MNIILMIQYWNYHSIVFIYNLIQQQNNISQLPDKTAVTHNHFQN